MLLTFDESLLFLFKVFKDLFRVKFITKFPHHHHSTFFDNMYNNTFYENLILQLSQILLTILLIKRREMKNNFQNKPKSKI